MDPLRLLFAVALAAAPIAWFLWRERRDTRPESFWLELAPALGLEYSPEPPALRGAWKGRPVELVSEGGRVVASARYSSGGRVRVEIGDRAQLERAAGMVVPDRVEFPDDPNFSERLLARAVPEEAGRLAADPSMRRRLAAMAGVHVLASSGRVDVTLPRAREEELRDMLDVAVAVAEAAESVT